MKVQLEALKIVESRKECKEKSTANNYNYGRKKEDSVNHL